NLVSGDEIVASHQKIVEVRNLVAEMHPTLKFEVQRMLPDGKVVGGNISKALIVFVRDFERMVLTSIAFGITESGSLTEGPSKFDIDLITPVWVIRFVLVVEF